MKKIFRGRKYDTDTAELVGSVSYSNRTDFGHWSEELYKKRTGEFFLYGEGGPASKYRETVGLNEWSGGEMIKPLTYDEAREWAEKNLDGDEYEKIFGDVDEDGEKRTFNLSLDAAIHEKLKQEAVKRGISVSALVSELARTL